MTTLAEELAGDPLARGYAAMSPAETAASLNAKDRPGPVPAIDVVRYLILQGKWAALKISTSEAAVNVIETLTRFDSIDLEAYRAQVEAALDAVVLAGLIDAAHKTAILAMADTRRSRASELGLGHVREADVLIARGA